MSQQVHQRSPQKIPQKYRNTYQQQQENKKCLKIRKDSQGRPIVKGGKHQISFNPKIQTTIGVEIYQKVSNPDVSLSISEESDSEYSVSHRPQIVQKSTEIQDIQIDFIVKGNDDMTLSKSPQKILPIEDEEKQSACCNLF